MNDVIQPRSPQSPEQILSAVKGIVSPKGAAALEKQVTPAPGSQPASAAPGSPAATPQGGEPAKPAQQADPLVIKSPLGDMVYGDNPASQVTLSSFADVQAYAKEVAGVELKDVSDIAQVLSDYASVKKSVTEVDTLKKQVANYEQTIKNLPPDVSLIVNAAIQGTDYMPVIQKLSQKAQVDFDKPFESHDPLKLINYYTGNSYDKAAFDALEPTVRTALTDSAKIKYSADKDDYTRVRSSAELATRTKQTAFMSSVDNSIAHMVAANPNMDKAVVERVRQIMTQGLSDALFTPDKVYNQDAAEKIAMMEYGKQTIQAQRQTIGDFVKKYRAAGATEATENILMRSDKPAPASGGAIDPNQIAAAVKAQTGFVTAR